jgi:putative ABC transport system permease protein
MCPPYNANYGYSGISWEGSSENEKKIEFAEISCDSHYANTFGLKVTDGEFIPPGLSWWQDTKGESYNIVINETFKKLMGVENPIGITVTYGWGQKGKIIGIVRDFNFKPLKEKVTPLILSFNPEQSFNVYVKTTGKDRQSTLEYILDKYKEMYDRSRGNTNRPVMYHTVEDEYNEMYAGELRTANMLTAFSIISFLLSLMGIISMVSFMIEKRTKEIAIRKINGAEMKDITGLFIRQFSLVAIISAAISIPVCYLVMNRWIQDYVYRTSLSWWIFLGIPAFIILVTAIIISVQITLTARRNPIESLRSE